MEFKSTDNIAMVYETLKNIDTAITKTARAFNGDSLCERLSNVTFRNGEA